jgi:hypothetical protein
LLGKAQSPFSFNPLKILHGRPIRAGSRVPLVLDLDETIEVGAKHIGHGVGVGFDLCRRSKGFRETLSKESAEGTGRKIGPILIRGAECSGHGVAIRHYRAEERSIRTGLECDRRRL